MGMKTNNAPTKDWAQRTDVGLAFLPLACPELFFLFWTSVAAPRIEALKTISGIQAWQQWKSSIGLQTFSPISPQEIRDAVTWMI